jgi:hypothetical protein
MPGSTTSTKHEIPNVLSIGISCFVLVGDFVLRISDVPPRAEVVFSEDPGNDSLAGNGSATEPTQTFTCS